MTSRELYFEIKGYLQGAGVEDAGPETDMLIEHVTGHSRFLAEPVEEEEARLLWQAARRRAKREPLQYILGSWPFLGIRLLVGPGVLIPRPETEEVCVVAGGFLAGRTAPVALDLCSGSGALALGLQSFAPAADITAVEWEADAFGYLTRNLDAYLLGEAYEHPPCGEEEIHRVPRAVRADVLAYHEGLAAERFDLIVSNPPYVTEAEYKTLAPEVHAEPRAALVAGQGGLAFYKAIARDYRRTLKPGGALVLEIGASQGRAVEEILRDNRYSDVEIRRDLAGCERIAIGFKPV